MSGGDQFNFGVDITLANGQKVSAFPGTGAYRMLQALLERSETKTHRSHRASVLSALPL